MSAGDVAALMQAEGLTGRLTGTPAGGLADLRSVHGAALTSSAFDESHHSADFRRGQGAVGHFGISKLLVFVWRLRSFSVLGGTPVAVANSAGEYVFDPTGREIPLFLPPPAAVDDFSGEWTAAREWQVPGPLTSTLETAIRDTGGSAPSVPYPDSDVPPRYALGGGTRLAAICPERGRFTTTSAPLEPFTVNYQYGFSSTIGAGPYERNLLGDPPATVGRETLVTGGSGLDAALTSIAATGTVTIADSLTYDALGAAPGPIDSLLVRAGPAVRPVLRAPAGAPPWVFTGAPGAQLVLDGLTVSGCDIVLRGAFDTVRITGCTVDPGTAAAGSPPLARAVDGGLLAPSRIFVEADPGAAGAIGHLQVEHCIVGPIRSRLGGSVQTVTISDSIVQGLPAGTGTVIFDPLALAHGLLSGFSSSGAGVPANPLAAALLAAMPGVAATLETYVSESPGERPGGLPLTVLNALDTLIVGPSIYNEALFRGVALNPEVRTLASASALDASHRAALNRRLLGEAFPMALGVAALAVAGATVQLERVTVLGRVAANRLFCSDSILAGFAMAEDTQDGSVRFSAYTNGSVVPRPYHSAPVSGGAPLFTSQSYGQPGYAQLLSTADAAIMAAADSAASISAGAEDGSEMGAFCAELNPLKERGLLVKYADYMPLGLAPVIIHVT